MSKHPRSEDAVFDCKAYTDLLEAEGCVIRDAPTRQAFHALNFASQADLRTTWQAAALAESTPLSEIGNVLLRVLRRHLSCKRNDVAVETAELLLEALVVVQLPASHAAIWEKLPEGIKGSRTRFVNGDNVAMSNLQYVDNSPMSILGGTRWPNVSLFLGESGIGKTVKLQQGYITDSSEVRCLGLYLPAHSIKCEGLWRAACMDHKELPSKKRLRKSFALA